MSSRGMLQLSRLNLVYSDWGASSNNFTEFLMSDYFSDFKNKFPTVETNLLIKRKSHPFVTGFYINGYIKELPIRLRSIPEIAKDLEYLASSCFLISWKRFNQARWAKCVHPSTVNSRKMDRRLI